MRHQPNLYFIPQRYRNGLMTTTSSEEVEQQIGSGNTNYATTGREAAPA